MFHLFIQHIINTIGTIDNLIEKNEEILNKIYEYISLEFENIYMHTIQKKTIGELNLYISDFVANGSFKSLKENTEILEKENFSYFIRNTDLKENSFERYVSKKTYNFLKKSALFGNEILVSNVGDVGSVYLAPKLDKPMTLGNNMILVTNEDRQQNFYLFLYFKSDYGQHSISGITAGSAQQKFNKTDFKKIEIDLPSDEQMYAFNKKISGIYEKYYILQKNNALLKKIKSQYLKKFFG